MSTPQKVKLIIPIENGDAQQTLEHLRNCQAEIEKLVKQGRMADEVLFKPKTSVLSVDNYKVYKHLMDELQSQINLMPVLLIDCDVDVSVGLLAERSAVLVMTENKGSISHIYDYSETVIGKDLEESYFFNELEPMKTMQVHEIIDKDSDRIMIETVPIVTYMKWAEAMGLNALHYVHDKNAINKLSRVTNISDRLNQKDKDGGIQLA